MQPGSGPRASFIPPLLKDLTKHCLAVFFDPLTEFWVVFSRDLDGDGSIIAGKRGERAATVIPDHGGLSGGLLLGGAARLTGRSIKDRLKLFRAGRIAVH